MPAFTPRLTRRRCCFQHQQHIDNLSQQSLLMLMWDQSSDSSHFLHQKFRLWWCHSYVRDQTPLVNNRLRRVQPLVQGDRQHRDNLSPKSPSCLDASSDSGTPLVKNRLRRAQPQGQGDRHHRDNISPKSPYPLLGWTRRPRTSRRDRLCSEWCGDVIRPVRPVSRAPVRQECSRDCRFYNSPTHPSVAD